MSKLDLKKELKYLYNPSPKQVVEVVVPPMNYLMIDGHGDPNISEDYKQAVEALFGLSYALKFASKKTNSIDYTVMPLEGLWWMDDMGGAYGDIDFTADKSKWDWTMMMMQPDHISREMVDKALDNVRKKKPSPALDKVRFERFDEGLTAQTLHIGPFDTERPTIDRVHAFIAESGGQLSGKHHEIYLSDFRRISPDKMKTVIRQPMQR